mmetsp:Transcript_107378/g.313967  ORF Transcript_107378/g.313967 Transcript_107378/m.313967 type:complete len:238 (+) Transcript_107378:114-827(+)
MWRCPVSATSSTRANASHALERTLSCTGPGHTPLILLQGLERVESGHRGIPAGLPVHGRAALVLEEEAVLVVPVHPEHLEALVQEPVLAPHARPRAEPGEVQHAARRPPRPGPHRVARQDLQRPVHAQPAVVDVHPARPLHLTDHDPAEPRWEEHRVRVRLHRPVVNVVPPVSDDSRPDREEDVRVQGGLELSAPVALEVALHNHARDTRSQLDCFAAVHRVLVAAKDAHSSLILPR